MPTTAEAFVTGKVLRWARERTGTSPDGLAKKLKTRPRAISSWEDGDSRPSFRQAERLAKRLNIPLAYLFLPEPPAEKIPLPDFRTARNTPLLEPSSDFIDLLHDVLAKHAWYKDLLQGEGSAPLSFVAKFGLNDGDIDVADDITRCLDISDEFRSACKNWENFLNRLIEKAEERRILVMRASGVAGNHRRKVSTDEFKGFAISDKLAPLIFINSSDFKAAQIFTLAHELAHVWLGETGISNESLAEESHGHVEEKCDRIAAEVLVPSRVLLVAWRETAGDVDSLARHFRVSSVVILRRARDLQQLSEDEFWTRYREAERHFRKVHKGGGGSFYRSLLARNSKLFTSTVIEAVMEQRELYREAASLLNVRVPTVPKIADYLAHASRKQP